MLRRLISICRALRKTKHKAKDCRPGSEGGREAAPGWGCGQLWPVWSMDGAEIQQFMVETKVGD